MDGRAGRIAREWRRLTQTSNSFYIEALNAIRPEVPAWRAIAMANVESAGGLDDAQETMFREALAEVFSTAVPAQILFDSFGCEQRPVIADVLAFRAGRKEPTFGDYFDADAQIAVIDGWARRSRAANFRRRSPDVLRDVAAELDWRWERSAYVPNRRITYRELSQIAGQSYESLLSYETQVLSGWGASQVRGSADMRDPRPEFYERRRKLITGRLVERCAELEISQNQLARMLGISHRQVWDWFHGVHAPMAYLDVLEEKLGVPSGYFTEDTEENAA